MQEWFLQRDSRGNLIWDTHIRPGHQFITRSKKNPLKLENPANDNNGRVFYYGQIWGARKIPADALLRINCCFTGS